MTNGSLASKVVKSSRNAIFKSYSKPAKNRKTAVNGDTVHGAAGAKPAVDSDELDSGYPDELSMEWYHKVNEQYENQDKAVINEAAAQDDCDCFSTATEPGNANEAFNRTSLNKPLPALPHPYFEYLFANAGVEKQAKAKKTFKPVIDTAGKPSCGVVKPPKNNSYDFVRPGLGSKPPIDYVKRDSDGSSIPDIPASAYPGAVGKENSIDNLSVAEEVQDADTIMDDDSPSPSPGPTTPTYNGTPPVTVDMSASTQFVFHQAKVPFNTKDVVDNHLISIGTGLANPFPEINEQESVEKEHTTAEFFDNADSTADESPLFHTTSTELSDVVYIRTDIDDIERVWMNPYAKSGGKESEASNQPMFRMKKPEEKTNTKGLTSKWIERRRAKGKSPSITVDGAASTTSSLKRPASDSFATRSARSDSNDSVQFLGSKRIRVGTSAKSIEFIDVPEVRNTSPVCPTLGAGISPITPRTPNGHEGISPVAHHLIVPSSPIYEPVEQNYSVYGSVEHDSPVYATRLPESPPPIEAGIFFPVGAGLHVEPPINFIDLTAQSLSATPATAIIGVTPSPPVYTTLNTTLPTPLTANYKGFPGQFLGPALNMLAAKTKMGAMKKPKVTIFGDRLHANGTIIHKECFPAPVTPIWNYTPETLSRHSTLFRTLEDMDLHNELASSEQVAMLRAVSQEDLRNEAHRELASARLEGVCVGQYRYYQGHLSVEEYVNKGLCVCWSPCACSRVCSRYGDVICPCIGDLELETDSESEGE